MTFDEYRAKHWFEISPENMADSGGAEKVWSDAQKDAQKETWEQVFQIVSDNPQMFSREAIKKLEAARERAGAGPMRQAA